MGVINRFERTGRSISTAIEEVSRWFEKYEVESIELSISGIVESSGITKLFVSDKEGMKIRLKPKDTNYSSNEVENIENISKKKIELLFPTLEEKGQTESKQEIE